MIARGVEAILPLLIVYKWEDMFTRVPIKHMIVLRNVFS